MNHYDSNGHRAAGTAGECDATGGETVTPWCNATATVEPSLDTVFDLLADRRRRYVIHYLATVPEQAVSLDGLIGRVVAWERAAEDGPVPSNHRRQVAIALHHVHLPKLVNAGVVDYDDRDGMIRYQGHAQLESLLDEVVSVDLPNR